jgi:hypothetical protein
MTPNYSTRELIELSLLDIMGLLDEDERGAFERAFAGTSPEIQAHIRREQTRLAHIDFMLPDVEAPAGLRSAVLEAVRRAMSEAAAEEVPGRPAFMPAMQPTRRVSPLWRAGAVGFATAAVVLGYTTVLLRGGYDELMNTYRNNLFADETLQRLGPSFEDLIFNEHIQHVVFKPATAGVRGQAALLLDTEVGTASLVCNNLPAMEGREYQLVVVSGDGAVQQQLASFVSTGLTTKPLKIRLVSGQRLAILPPANPGEGPAAAILATDPLRI